MATLTAQSVVDIPLTLRLLYQEYVDQNFQCQSNLSTDQRKSLFITLLSIHFEDHYDKAIDLSYQISHKFQSSITSQLSKDPNLTFEKKRVHIFYNIFFSILDKLNRSQIQFGFPGLHNPVYSLFKSLQREHSINFNILSALCQNQQQLETFLLCGFNKSHLINFFNVLILNPSLYSNFYVHVFFCNNRRRNGEFNHTITQYQFLFYNQQQPSDLCLVIDFINHHSYACSTVQQSSFQPVFDVHSFENIIDPHSYIS